MTYRTINKDLIDKLLKAKESDRMKVLNKQWMSYKNKLIKNNKAFNNNAADPNFEKYTLNTIYGKFENYIKNNKDLNELKRVLHNTISNAREFNKQRKKIEKEQKQMESSTNNTYIYVLTHPTKTGIHSQECLNRLANNPYTKQQALDAMNDLPEHRSCTCHFIVKE